jgi:hypothetical protein
MINQILSGSKCLLDEKTEVIVLKPATRSNSAYSIEIPGQRIETVSRERLTVIPQASGQRAA